MPLSIEQIADSVGKKFLGWITNNGGTNVAAAPKGVNLATQNGDSVADLAVSLDGEIVTAKTDLTTPGTTNLVRAGSGATDDAAAAGEFYPIGALYAATRDEVDSGDVGRVAMNKRRALINVMDHYTVAASSSSVASAGDLTVGTSTIDAANNAPSTAFFNGADVGFGASVRHIKIPMANWKECGVTIQQTLGVNMDVAFYGAHTSGFGSAAYKLLATATTTTTGSTHVFSHHDLSGGASGITQVKGLNGCYEEIIVALTPASDPSSGSVAIVVTRKA